MQGIRDGSQQERRVYVGNLSYDVKWHNLKDFMRQAGEVLYADVLLMPNGMSKGCGIVEYATKEDAQNAINMLSNQNLMGRLVYVREDRKSEPKFASPATPAVATQQGFAGYTATGGPTQVYVSNLPYSVGWQELKDLFRQAGNTVRANILTTPDGRPKGSGTVLFESPEDARNAIAQFNGFEWNGRIIEVREDRFQSLPQRGTNFARGGYVPRGGYTSRGAYRGGYSGFSAGRAQSTNSVPANEFTDNVTGGGEPSDTIFVRNLPWPTTNDDLNELFSTIGLVEKAEIQYEPTGRSKGSGVVKFDNEETAQDAITKFQGYMYGERPLGLSYARYLVKTQSDGVSGTGGHGVPEGAPTGPAAVSSGSQQLNQFSQQQPSEQSTDEVLPDVQETQEFLQYQAA